MRSRKITQDDLANPSGILGKLINDYIERRFDPQPPLRKVVVIDVDLVGGQITPEGEPLNPKNSILGKLLDDTDNTGTDSDYQTFWPMFPHDMMPIKPGEHAYVMSDAFGDRSGVWVCRIPQPLSVDNTPIDNKNFVDGTAQYLADERNEFSEISAQQFVQQTETPPPEILQDENFIVEDPLPPSHNGRVGERVIEGSHNSAIILGRDRVTDVTTGIAGQSGDVRIVAGKAGEDVDLLGDASTILVTQNTDIDVNMDTTGVGTGNLQQTDPAASIAVRSNQIRIVAREGMKIVVEGGDLFLNAANVTIGDGNSDEEFAPLGERLKDLIESLITMIETHTHATPVGPSLPTVDIADNITAAKKDLQAILSETVKTKP
jgi:hypothetical protein